MIFAGLAWSSREPWVFASLSYDGRVSTAHFFIKMRIACLDPLSLSLARSLDLFSTLGKGSNLLIVVGSTAS